MHLAIERAVKFQKRHRKTEIPGAQYDPVRGYWVSENGGPLVHDPDGPRPESKKCDVETGEDKKGE